MEVAGGNVVDVYGKYIYNYKNGVSFLVNGDDYTLSDNAPIRGADISGGSARLELGATLQPTERSPWSLDLNVTGFAGKKRGVNGGVTMKYLF